MSATVTNKRSIPDTSNIPVLFNGIGSFPLKILREDLISQAAWQLSILCGVFCNVNRFARNMFEFVLAENATYECSVADKSGIH